MGSRFRGLWRAITFFRHYQPQPVTIRSIWLWLRQFPLNVRFELLSLLSYVIFVSQRQTEGFLEQRNAEVLSRLAEEGLGPENIIYVELDTAGSSSGVMLNVLRDRQNLERRRSKFISTRDGDLMTQYSNTLETGAVVYVDDFSGSGRQFLRNRKRIAPFITGNFAEFFVAACICEEAIDAIEPSGVVPLPGMVHLKSERPLHDECTLLSPSVKERLISISEGIHRRHGIGFLRMATMVILARNAPNSTPLLLRGSLRQRPIKGVFPRWDDLPF
jgi:hypothetical protein